MALEKIESRLEKLFDRPFSRGLKSPLQPIEIGRRIAREMELNVRIGPRGKIAPNEIRVYVSLEDAKRFEGFEKALPTELTASAREYALQEGYDFVGPVAVEIFVDETRSLGELALRANFTQGRPTPKLIANDGQVYDVTPTPKVIGRTGDCDVVIADSNVSRRHAEVWEVNGSVAIRDLGSTNGTFVNGHRIDAVTLSPHDEVVVGTTSFRVELA